MSRSRYRQRREERKKAAKALEWIKLTHIPTTMEFDRSALVDGFSMELGEEWVQESPRRFRLAKNIHVDAGDSLLSTFPGYSVAIDGVDQPPMRVALIPTAGLTRLRKERARILGFLPEDVIKE